ncbi:protein COFACTOR ASSEMBLY OF COMPLEX C SUBUNIT B CCB3, chloroplastic [Quillaja saponaria]|uniref:Protein COFACTOR ASSEMBLY OF COMPLEX C SUBUNIT B CCB3, chloroplastic n=1 Tax=Quillaja saponaria TaxID=32244 RepID=A0AAD7Q369_QUISA|nr:protein COFACTOR ASSEMBLY OF COMPLEX C SUBUNIT B CCB3, chloroplastic [Quillaja saponaria]
MATRTVFVGWKPVISKPRNFQFSQESFKYLTKTNLNEGSQSLRCGSFYTEVADSPAIELPLLDLATPWKPFDPDAVSKFPNIDIAVKSHSSSDFMQILVLGDLDPATAKLAIGYLGPLFSVFSFLFILRIVMSWYPKLPVGKFPYVIAYAPTEPLLIPTRKLIPPLGGVDVTPVVWFGLVSFLNEILVGPQGLLVLLSQQGSGIGGSFIPRLVTGFARQRILAGPSFLQNNNIPS